VARTRSIERPARATLQTVADALGVSRSTVSNAYGRPDELSAELRARILETAERLGYPGPNPSARSLRRGRVGAIGVLFTARLSTAFRDPYAVSWLGGLAELVEARETSLLLIPVPYEDDDRALDPVRNAAVDGFCVYYLPDTHRALDVLRARRLPVVGGLDPDALWPGAWYIGADERAAARAGAAHVVALGHRRVTLIADWVTERGDTRPIRADGPDGAPYYVTRERLRGFADAFAAAGVPYRDLTVVHAATNNRTSGAAAAAYALDRQDRSTAVLATSDVLAAGVLDAMRVRGLRPGRDVSVTGFDDIPEAAALGLTTVSQPSAERGRLDGELLLAEDGDPRPVRFLPTHLVVRASTGPAPL
jgi:DNA-binding LacI/PurR family transcriptional regulator